MSWKGGRGTYNGKGALKTSVDARNLLHKILQILFRGVVLFGELFNAVEGVLVHSLHEFADLGGGEGAG